MNEGKQAFLIGQRTTISVEAQDANNKTRYVGDIARSNVSRDKWNSICRDMKQENEATTQDATTHPKTKKRP